MSLNDNLKLILEGSGTINDRLAGALPSFPSGQYLFINSQAAGSTSGALGNNTLRLAPRYLPYPMSISRVGGEITVIGDVGSKLRLGVYADNGAMMPGNLVADFGQIAGDSATVQEIVLGSPLVLQPGTYWWGGAIQAAATTQPTVRTTGSTYQGSYDSYLFLGNTIPSAGAGISGYSMSGVSAGLPASFTNSGSVGAAPRLFVKTT